MTKGEPEDNINGSAPDDQPAGGDPDGTEGGVTILSSHLDVRSRMRAMRALGYTFVLRCRSPAGGRTVALLEFRGDGLVLSEPRPVEGSYRLMNMTEYAGFERYLRPYVTCHGSGTPLMVLAQCQGYRGCPAADTEVGAMVANMNRVRVAARQTCGEQAHAEVPLTASAPWLGSPTCIRAR